MPDHGVVIATSDDQCFGARYLQLTEGLRPDVTFACGTLLARAWYRERLAIAFEPQATPVTSARQAEAILAHAPLLVDDDQSAILAALPSYPYGVLRRVLPRGAAVPSLGDIVAQNRALYETFALDEPRPAAADDFAALAHRRYAANWIAIGNLLAHAGDRDGAASAYDVARQLQPER